MQYLTRFPYFVACVHCMWTIWRMLQGFHTPLLFPIQYILKLNLFCMIFNIIYKKMNLSKQTQNSTLCQQDLKGCRINTNLVLKRNYLCKAISSSLYRVWVHGHSVNQEEQKFERKDIKGKKNLVFKFRFSKLMLLTVMFVRNSTELPFWECAVTLH